MYSTTFFAFLATSLGLVGAASAQIVPSCGTTGDPTCLITTAQYTVLGTVISNNANTTGSPTNYNATIDVSCVYASFGVSQGVGAGLADAKVLVSGFGDPYPGCPNNLGASAPVNQTEIFFIYVANRVGQNATPFYTIFNPCGGGLSNSTGNLEAIRSTLEKNPKNSVLKGSQCALPAPLVTSTSSTLTATASGSTPTLSSSPSPNALTGSGSGASHAWSSVAALTMLVAVAGLSSVFVA